MVDLSKAGGESMAMAQVKLFGINPKIINQLTSIGTINKAVRLKNEIYIDAGDSDSMQNVFQGTIFDAWADYNASPNVAFNVVAYSGLGASLKPVDASSYQGSTSVSQIMSDLASEAGFAFEDYGVQVQLSSPYFAGTTLAKIRSCARQAGIFHHVDHNTLIIAPKTSAVGSALPSISPETGMVGYPTLSSKGMALKTVFNNDIILGGNVQVTSSIQMACGKFNITNLSHSLSCQVPDGPWFTSIEAYSVAE